MSRLITSSLIDSVSWLRMCPQSWKERARTQLVAALSRIYPPQTEQQKRGNAFEDAVYRFAKLPPEQVGGSDHFKWFVEQARGFAAQYKSKRMLKIGEQQCCIYAKFDLYTPEVVKDIKTTDNYKGEQKYMQGSQHLLYPWLCNAKKFYYLVAAFDGSKITNHYCHEYIVPDTLTTLVMQRINETIAFLSNDEELLKLWTTKYSLY